MLWRSRRCGRRSARKRAKARYDKPEYRDARGHRLIAAAIGTKLDQVAVACVMAKGVPPIVGPRTRTQLDDYIAATTVKLDTDHINGGDYRSVIVQGV